MKVGKIIRNFMKKRLIVLSGLGLAIITPLFALAQNISTGTGCRAQVGIQGVICKIGEIINTAIPILIVLGVAYFIWGVITYVISDDEEAKSKGRDRIIFGIIGLVVIVGMWGLVKIVTSTFGLDNNSSTIELPCVPGTVCDR